MKSWLRQVWTVRIVGLGVVLASLIVVLFAIDPAPAPAAFTDVESGVAATPVAVATTGLIDGFGCDGKATNMIETIVDAPSMEELATPVAIGGEDGSDWCLPAVLVPDPQENVVPELSADPLAFQHRPSGNETRESNTGNATPVIDSPAQVGEPTLVELPGEYERAAQVEDPTLLGIPMSGGERVSTTVDPMLAGVAVEAPEDDLFVDPFVVGLAIPRPTDVTSSPTDRIDINVISIDGSVMPGGRTAYFFRISNPGQHAVSLRLQATVDQRGWSAAVYAIGSTSPLTSLLKLEAGEGFQVAVIVTAPREAVIGDRASTGLNAIIGH